MPAGSSERGRQQRPTCPLHRLDAKHGVPPRRAQRRRQPANHFGVAEVEEEWQGGHRRKAFDNRHQLLRTGRSSSALSQWEAVVDDSHRLPP